MTSLNFLTRKKVTHVAATALATTVAILLASELSGSLVQATETKNDRTEIRGMVRSFKRIAIKPELDTRITKLNFLPGQSFNEGEVLYELDCAKYRAERAAANASFQATRVDLAGKQKLLAHQAIGRNEVQLAQAAANKAQAQLQIRNAINQQCSMKAPFSGRVVDVNASTHEFLPHDKPLMVVMDDKALEIELVVPSRWLAWLKNGQRFHFHVDETDKTHIAIVRRIAAEVDAVSQTVKIIAGFEEIGKGKEMVVLPGMSGTAVFRDAS